MIAHIGITVSDIEISKKFYAQALNPIGYQLLREYDVTPARPAASAGFGEPPRADLWIYQGIYVHGREQEQREASPTAAIIDARA